MKIHLATDHAGFGHKEIVKEYLAAQGMEVVDHGATNLVPEDDYPDYVTPCAEAVAAEEGSMGIIFGASGQGEAMCANRVPGIRAALYYGEPARQLILSREHNDANVLSIGANFVAIDDLVDIVAVWLATPFSDDERHVRRLAKF